MERCFFFFSKYRPRVGFVLIKAQAVFTQDKARYIKKRDSGGTWRRLITLERRDNRELAPHSRVRAAAQIFY